VGAGLFVRTLHNLKTLDVGIATDHLVTFRIEATLAGYRPDQARDVDARVLQTLAALPGVRSAAGTNDAELADTNYGNNITIAGYREKDNEDMNVESPSVSSGYFATMGMTLLAGRGFTEQDRIGTPKVAVVNESFARHFFGEPRLALGHYYGKGAGQIPIDTEIVGVAKDARHTGVRQEIARTTFTPFLQEPNPSAMTFYVRTWQAPESAEGTVRRAMQELDSKLVMDNFRTMQEQIDDNLTSERVIAILASSFGVLAVLMAAVGLYGVLAYSTAQRTREIGIRIALGAGRTSVMRMVLIEVLWLAGISIAVALPASLLLTRAARSQLFGISSSDPLTLIVVTLLVSVVAMASALLPARRAAKTDPIVALRYE
jgi:predicted permease